MTDERIQTEAECRKLDLIERIRTACDQIEFQPPGSPDMRDSVIIPKIQRAIRKRLAGKIAFPSWNGRIKE